MTKQAPTVALVHLPTVFYNKIFDLSITPTSFFLCMPLGLMYLSAALKQRSNASEVFLIDYAVATSELRKDVVSGERDLSDYRRGPDRFIVETAQAAARMRVPDVIAVSLNLSTSRSIGMQIVECLSRLWPDALVVFGGNHVTNDVPYLLQHPDIDVACRGEADQAFPEFINGLVHSAEPRVKGFYYKHDIAENKPIGVNCDYPENLDELPFPDWDLIDVSAYQVAENKRGRSVLSDKGARNFSIITSRGCPYVCTFCASHTVHGRKMRFRSVENVLAEMREIHTRFNATLFAPDDDMFAVNKKHTLSLLAGIKGMGISNLEMQFPSALSVNTLDEEVIDALCGAGMKIFSLAIESGSPYTQTHLIKKRVNLDHARRLVKYANGRNLYTRINFIIGFPGEKMEHIQETIDFAKILGADWNAFQVATPLLGSEMFDEFRAMGVLDFKSRNWENTYFERGFDTKEFKAEELVEIAYRANLEVNFIHNRQMRLGNWKLALDAFTDVTRGYPFHIIAHYQILLCLENMGLHEEASRRLEQVRHLVATEEASAKMLRKYGGMFPGFLERMKE